MAKRRSSSSAGGKKSHNRKNHKKSSSSSHTRRPHKSRDFTRNMEKSLIEKIERDVGGNSTSTGHNKRKNPVSRDPDASFTSRKRAKIAEQQDAMELPKQQTSKNQHVSNTYFSIMGSAVKPCLSVTKSCISASEIPNLWLYLLTSPTQNESKEEDKMESNGEQQQNGNDTETDASKLAAAADNVKKDTAASSSSKNSSSLNRVHGAMPPSWCVVDYKSAIPQVVCLYLHGVSDTLWQRIRIKMDEYALERTNKSSATTAETETPQKFSEAFNPYAFIQLKAPWDYHNRFFWKNRTKNASSAAQKQPEEPHLIAKDRGQIIQLDNKMLRNLFYVKKEKPLKKRKEYTSYATVGSTLKALRQIQEKHNNAAANGNKSTTASKSSTENNTTPSSNQTDNTTSETSSTNACTIEQLLLTEHDLKENQFPNSTDHSSFLTLPPGKCNYEMVGIDCEMCETCEGKELTRVTFVDHEHNVLYDELVKPHNEITNYHTPFSGITEEKLRNVTLTLDDVHEYIKTTFTESTVFVGHSLESDLHALKLMHKRVIDTSLLFPHHHSNFKHSLKNLCRKWLNREIQTAGQNGHDSVEDACAAMELTRKKLKHGLQYGRVHLKHENFLKQISRGKKVCLVDESNDLRNIVNGAASSFPCPRDEETVQKAEQCIHKKKSHFTWAHLHSVEQWYQRNAAQEMYVTGGGSDGSNQDTTSETPSGNGDSTTKRTQTEIPLPSDVESRLMRYLKTIYDACDDFSLICIIGSPQLFSLQHLSEKYLQCKEEEKKQELAKEIRKHTEWVHKSSFAHFCVKGGETPEAPPV